MTTGKTIALTMHTFVGKVMSLLFNSLQASFNFVAAVTIHGNFGAQENKTCHCFQCFPHPFAMKWWDRVGI